ncbi:MAG: CAP domain-containing protein [Actinomycetota bacterium]
MILGRFARRSGTSALLAFALLLFPVTASHARAQTAANAERQMFGYVSTVRANYGKRAVVLSTGLSDVARRHSRAMRDRGRIYHSNLPYLIRSYSWTRAGENVGRGPTVLAIHRAFWSSSTHRAVLLNSYWRKAGIGVVWNGSTAYVTEIFTN